MEKEALRWFFSRLEHRDIKYMIMMEGDETGSKKNENKRLKLSRDVLQSDKIKELQGQIKMLVKERDDIKRERDSLQKMKRSNDLFTSKLRDRVECPVCLEVPTSGPIHVCPNGHFVCFKCKKLNCPTCRTKMLRGKSLLAVTVIENIGHKCKHDDCEELLPLKEYERHLETCAHNPANRVVLCPAPKDLCGREMELGKIFHHFMNECTGSRNIFFRNNRFQFQLRSNQPFSTTFVVSDFSVRGVALNCDGSHFYLSLAKLPACFVFSIQLFGNKVECEQFEVNMSVGRKAGIGLGMRGNPTQRITCEPLPVEMDQQVKNANGLMIGLLQMEKFIDRTMNWNPSIEITLQINKLPM